MTRRTRVLVACECSGVVRRAFRALGCDAWSCDLKDSEDSSPYHLQGDVLQLLRLQTADRWDLMIAHPPCTYLASSGLHWNGRIPGRAALTTEAFTFAVALLEADVERICVENPVGRLAAYRSADQSIHPHWFGHDASKRTMLWLKKLPPLIPTKRVPPGPDGRWANQTPSGQNKLGPSPTRAADRSRTYPGIADAMAAQWAPLLFS